MRRNIALKYRSDKKPSIYLYTHWGADGLECTLANALERGRERWGDESYLARIIFTDMTADAKSELTGYGLSPYEIDPEFKTLTVDLGEMTVNKVPFEDFLENPQMFAV